MAFREEYYDEDAVSIANKLGAKTFAPVPGAAARTYFSSTSSTLVIAQLGNAKAMQTGQKISLSARLMKETVGSGYIAQAMGVGYIIPSEDGLVCIGYVTQDGAGYGMMIDFRTATQTALTSAITDITAGSYHTYTVELLNSYRRDTSGYLRRSLDVRLLRDASLETTIKYAIGSADYIGPEFMFAIPTLFQSLSQTSNYYRLWMEEAYQVVLSSAYDRARAISEVVS